LGLLCADIPQNSRLSDSMSASCTRATYTSGQRLGYEGMMKWNITTHYLENGLGAFSLPSSIVSTPSTPWLDHRIEVVQHGARPRRRQPSTWKNRVGSIITIFLSWAWRWSRCWACWWMLFPRYTPRSISLRRKNGLQDSVGRKSTIVCFAGISRSRWMGPPRHESGGCCGMQG
jgi:hypothetical protein